jgi:tetratricopeptide (TPR) repeat protein
MTDQATELSADELMHLALYATEQNTPEKAIVHLKKLLNMEPDHAKARYLLGALHAQIGLHAKAAEEMAQALVLEPDLHTARFQLGLLHITAGRTAEAEQVWEGLNTLGDRDPLYLFKKGMLHLVRDEFEQCVEALKSGIELNTYNEDLNNDMRRVLGDAEKALQEHPAALQEAKDGAAEANGQHMLLSIYESKENEEDY